MRFTILALSFMAVAAQAQEPKLNFNIAKLCQWQNANNSMDVAECAKLEEEGKAAMAGLEAKGQGARIEDCRKEAFNFSGDSTFASYTVYATCLKDGPGSL